MGLVSDSHYTCSIPLARYMAPFQMGLCIGFHDAQMVYVGGKKLPELVLSYMKYLCYFHSFLGFKHVLIKNTKIDLLLISYVHERYFHLD